MRNKIKLLNYESGVQVSRKESEEVTWQRYSCRREREKGFIYGTVNSGN